MKKKKIKKIKTRNPYALPALMRKAGKHRDKREKRKKNRLDIGEDD